LPETVGSKLMERVHEAPEAKLPASDEVVISGQAVEAELSSVKCCDMLGLLPAAGGGRVSGVLPVF
jgi:hypothetical protein